MLWAFSADFVFNMAMMELQFCTAYSERKFSFTTRALLGFSFPCCEMLLMRSLAHYLVAMIFSTQMRYLSNFSVSAYTTALKRNKRQFEKLVRAPGSKAILCQYFSQCMFHVS